MLLAVAGAVVPVAIGLGLGATPLVAHGVLHHARGLALAVTLGVLLLVLMPEAWHEVGAWSLVALAAGIGLPMAVERFASSLGGGEVGHRAADELAFAGVLVHQLADGVQIGAGHAGGHGVAVTTAIALHTIPLLAAVALRYTADDHARLAPRAALLLVATGAASAAGYALVGALPGHVGWLPALVGGLLLHVLWHDFPVHEHHEH